MFPLSFFVIQHLSFTEGNINEYRIRLVCVENRFVNLGLGTQHRFLKLIHQAKLCIDLETRAFRKNSDREIQGWIQSNHFPHSTENPIQSADERVNEQTVDSHTGLSQIRVVHDDERLERLVVAFL